MKKEMHNDGCYVVNWTANISRSSSNQRIIIEQGERERNKEECREKGKAAKPRERQWNTN